MSTLGGYHVLIIHTKGVKTGKIRKTPVIYMMNDKDYFCVGSFGGSPKDPQWVKNLSNDSRVLLEIKGIKMTADAEFLNGFQRTEIWEKLINFYPGFKYYQSVTSRCIPIIKFTPKN